MITIEQINELAKKYKINESVVAREYFQVLFLMELYSKDFAEKVYFKGGTAIRILYGGQRFSEDLDFTVMLDEEKFSDLFEEFMRTLVNLYPISYSKKRSISGKTFMLVCNIENFKHPITIKLDFSFREIVLEPKTAIISTDYPIISRDYIVTMSKDEIIAEKIRALTTRNKLRDLYDLWILLELGGKLDINLINKKLSFYKETFDARKLISHINQLDRQKFVVDLRPFVPSDQREKLPKFFDYIQDYCIQRIG